jgi:hypothetical protein
MWPSVDYQKSWHHIFSCLEKYSVCQRGTFWTFSQFRVLDLFDLTLINVLRGIKRTALGEVVACST